MGVLPHIALTDIEKTGEKHGGVFLMRITKSLF